MPYFNIITESNESTVVTEYTPVEKNAKSYQTEAQLEAEFIRMLQSQGIPFRTANGSVFSPTASQTLTRA